MLTLKITWQRLVDENRTCPRCDETDKELNKACLKLKEVLSPLGIDVSLEKKELTLDEFKANPLGSNKIWIGDKTMEEWLNVRSGKSPCCDICGDNECRTVEVGNQIYETIPASLITKAGLIAAAEILPVEESKSLKVQDLRFSKINK